LVKFNSKTETYRELSNFYDAPFVTGYPCRTPLNDSVFAWRTVEHYYQAQKFEDFELYYKIKNEETVNEAKRIAAQNHDKIRPDWETIKDDVMRIALFAKFTQNHHCAVVLLRTGSDVLVEYSPWGDRYWGDGGDGTGENRLGKMLMEVRDYIKENFDWLFNGGYKDDIW
jgi:ribA/ribD-fused uncharacterized protein